MFYPGVLYNYSKSSTLIKKYQLYSTVEFTKKVDYLSNKKIPLNNKIQVEEKITNL